MKKYSRHNHVFRRECPEAILKIICEVMNIHIRDLRGNYRFPFCVDARIVVAKVFRDRNWSKSKIGNILNRDRSSVYHLLNIYPERIQIRPHLHTTVEHVKNLIEKEFNCVSG